jgi:hypothetical protein
MNLDHPANEGEVKTINML